MKIIFAYSILFFSFLPLAFAQDEEENPQPVDVQIGSSIEAFRSDPAGSQIGTLMPRLVVKRLYQRGRWVKVAAEGWVREEGISELGTAAASSAANQAPVAKASDVLSLLSYDVKNISKAEAGDRARIQIKLRVKNNTANPITSWEGLLVVETKAGNLLFRAQVSSEVPVIPASGEADVSLYWADGEQYFDELAGHNKDSLKIGLFKTVAN